MVFGNEFHENSSRRREFKTSYSVESLTSGSSDGESYSPRLSHVRKSQLQRTKSFHQIIHEMSSSTKKLEEETSVLLRDMVRFLWNINIRKKSFSAADITKLFRKTMWFAFVNKYY